MNNKLISIIVVIALIGVGFLLFKGKSVAPTVPVAEEEQDNTEVSPVLPEASVKEFNVDATSFSYSPSSMMVNKGDTVKITVKNINGTHDLKIDEFGASTRTLKTGETETIAFVADESGTFEYYCSIGNHRAMGMVGKLVVQ